MALSSREGEEKVEKSVSKASLKRRKNRKIEKLRTECQTHRQGLRMKWKDDETSYQEIDEQQQKWSAGDDQFTSAIRRMAEQNRAYYEAIQEQREMLAAKQLANGHCDEANYKLHYYMPKLNEHPCMNPEAAKNHMFSQKVDRFDSGFISNTLIECLAAYGTEMGLEAFIGKSDFTEVFQTKFFSEMPDEDLSQVFDILSQNELFPLSCIRQVVERIFSTPKKYLIIYQCFFRLVSSEAFLKWKVTTTAKERKLGYPGPDIITLKDLKKVSRGEWVGSRDAQPHPRRALLAQHVLSLMEEDDKLFKAKQTKLTLADYAAALGRSHILLTAFAGSMFDSHFADMLEGKKILQEQQPPT